MMSGVPTQPPLFEFEICRRRIRGRIEKPTRLRKATIWAPWVIVGCTGYGVDVEVKLDELRDWAGLCDTCRQPK